LPRRQILLRLALGALTLWLVALVVSTTSASASRLLIWITVATRDLRRSAPSGSIAAVWRCRERGISPAAT
jgi:hypothetical protein